MMAWLQTLRLPAAHGVQPTQKQDHCNREAESDDENKHREIAVRNIVVRLHDQSGIRFSRHTR
jgi:hypothetical protein